MKKPSAGILVYRRVNGQIEVLLGHPGGPFWAKKDLGAWSIPKGEFEEDESRQAAAEREFQEEVGQPAPQGPYLDLGNVQRPDGKVIYIWAVEGDVATGKFSSNMFEMEWPPKSGKMQQFPEIDRIAWVPLHEAPAKMHVGQVIFIERLASQLGISIEPDDLNQPTLF